jgi:hypothetical protein
MDVPVYYLDGAPPAPSAVKVNVEQLAAIGRDYFACTNAYQIAMALSMGATEIGLYGTPLQGNREVVVERPCVSYWIGLAEGRGVHVHVEHDRNLGLMRHPYRYALDDVKERRVVYNEAQYVKQSLEAWMESESVRLGVVHAS